MVCPGCGSGRVGGSDGAAGAVAGPAFEVADAAEEFGASLAGRGGEVRVVGACTAQGGEREFRQVVLLGFAQPDPLLGTKQQEVVARLWKRRQTETGWFYLVGMPSYRVREDGEVEAAEYQVWVRAPQHVRPVDGVDYDKVVAERLEPSQSAVREVLGERRPSGWVLQKLGNGRGPAQGVLHARDCEEAPKDAPLLDLDQALDVAENPATRLCTLCGCAQELTPPAARLRSHRPLRGLLTPGPAR